MKTKQRPKPTAESPKPKEHLPVLGMIGLGIMGSAMAPNLLRAGYQVVGYDVDRARVRDHERAGGTAARSSGDVGTRATIVISSLPSAAALETVAGELAATRGRCEIVIETSTMPVEVKERARRTLAAAGITLLDCPVSGAGSQAIVKDIIVFVSGPKAAARRVAPVLNGFSRAHYYVGSFGAGSKTKFVANLLVGIHTVAAAEAMVLAMKGGLDPALTLKAIADGGGSSRMLQIRGPLMVAGHYSEPTMKLGVWQKDVAAITDFARSVGCPTPMFAAALPIYVGATNGRAGDDMAAVCAVLEQLANYRRRGHKSPRKRVDGTG